jgi:endonuclease/exonuclease/phosphatase family metal-dependent hydrolase
LVELKIVEFLKRLFRSIDNYCSLIICRLKNRGFICVDIPAPSILSGKFIDSGLVIVSRFPILHTDHITFSVGSGVDAYVGKGCLYAKILYKNANVNTNVEIPIHVFNTHLQAGYDSGRETHEANRLLQMAEMRNFIELKTKFDYDPILVFGDFNVNGRAGRTDGRPSSEYADMLQRVFPPTLQMRDVRMRNSSLSYSSFDYR